MSYQKPKVSYQAQKNSRPLTEFLPKEKKEEKERKKDE